MMVYLFTSKMIIQDIFSIGTSYFLDFICLDYNPSLNLTQVDLNSFL